MKSFFQNEKIQSLFSRYPLIPHNDKPQAIRIRRLFMAIATHTMIIISAYIGAGLGLVDYKHVNILLAFVVLFQLIFYLFIRSSLNLRLADPSMTEPQMYAAVLFLTYLMYFAYNAGGVFIALYPMIFLFGVFNLNTRKFLKITVFSLVTYGLTIYTLYQLKPQGISLRVELLKWVTLAIMLPCFSFIGGYISSLKYRLRKNHTELEAALETIKEMAIRDDLTGLLNRRHLMEIFEIEAKRAVRTGQIFSLIMMDIDKFKEVNDTMGHVVGDTVIREVARITKDTLRMTDHCGRYGGDEFILILTQTKKEGAMTYAERIRRRIEQIEHREWAADFHVSVSIGVTEYFRQEAPARTITRADEALYLAKNKGRNRVECLMAQTNEEDQSQLES
ncbi:MAG: hypothetical protein CSYNP_03613 [Syntrophus sp. SKADARSKE-3]|nr:hypothetical protein [Syntrophus sp. SKADARSKE-3]